jgi:subtilisin family serine protease
MGDCRNSMQRKQLTHLFNVISIWIAVALLSVMPMVRTFAQDAQYIVSFKEGRETFEEQARSLINHALQDIDRIPVERSVVVRLPFHQAVEVAKRSDVIAMELDQRVFALGSTNDPLLSSQTSLFGSYSAQVTDAWDITTGARDVVVAVIDSGASLSHPDLRANLWRNRRERAGNNRDDDNNGCVDDIYGCDFVNRDGSPEDDNGHGTHVTGIVAAVGDNAIGVAGVAFNARVVPVKVLDADGGGFISTVIKGIDYVTELKKRGVPIAAINLSLGGTSDSTALYRATERARNHDIMILAAAGNEASDNDSYPIYPANLDLANVISVGAVTSSGMLASYSNYGETSVDVAAPGSGVLSLGLSGYRTLSGTSMATPHVAGIVALIKSINSNLTVSQVRSILLSTVQVTPDLEGYVATAGIVDAYAAVQVAQITEPLSRIYGTIKTVEGRGLRNARVVLRSLEESSELVESMRTAKDGSYSFTDLPNGRYQIRVKKRSYRFRRRRVSFDTGRTVRRNFKARR